MKSFFAVDLQQIVSVERVKDVTKISTSDHIRGITQIRGEIMPVIDLKQQLFLMKAEHTEHSRYLVARINNSYACLLVDSATEIITIPHADIEKLPPLVRENETIYIDGVTGFKDKLVTLLNIEEMFKESANGLEVHL